MSSDASESDEFWDTADDGLSTRQDNARSVGLIIPGMSASEASGVSLSITPEALEFTLKGAAHAWGRAVGMSSPAIIPRKQVSSIKRIWTGGYVVRHSASYPSPLQIATAADNARLEADLREAGYPVESPRFSQRTRRLVIGSVLAVDAAFIVTLIVGGGNWVGWAMPVVFLGTIAALVWFK